jgi:hypothetical protein
MKYRLLLAALFVGVWIRPAGAITSRVGSAQDLGFGFAAGQPMGVTAKYWLSSTSGVDAFMGYHFNSNFDMHADYLLHTYSSFNFSEGRLPLYIGVGGRVLLGNDSQLGLRIPIGASYLLPTSPVEIFAEVAPVIQLVTSIGADIDGQIGFRVYINYLK